MIAAQVAGAGAAGRAVHNGTNAARDSGGEDSAFAGLMSNEAATSADRASSAATPATTEAESGGDEDTADTPSDPTLPEQLLALIAGTPAAASATATTPVSAPVAGAALLPTTAPGTPATAAVAIPATTDALAHAAASATATAVSALATGPESLPAPLQTAGSIAGDAASQASLAATPALAATPTSAIGSTDAIPLGDFAKALGLAGTEGTAPASAGLDTATPEIGDRGTLLAPTASAAPTPARAPTAMAAPLALPAEADAGFDDGFGARIGWLADQRIGRAEIRLNPEHLGAIDVRLQIDGSKVSAEFQSAHADVRHALENSVGRLREMLGQQGLQLTHADVGQGRGGEHGERAATTRGDDLQSERDAGPGEHPMPRPLLSRGLLDEYA